MRVVTASEMKAIDRTAIEKYGVPGSLLMENAGAAVAERAEAVIKEQGTGNILVIAGPGNNGGDGFVAARLLSEKGQKVEVVVLADETGYEGEAAEMLKKLKGVVTPVFNPGGDVLKAATARAAVIIDAVFGTGFKGKVSDEAAQVICAINCSGSYVISIDIPSGVLADTGKTGGAAVEADETVTFGLVKLGCVLYPGALYAGNLITADIGFPEEAVSGAGHVSYPSAAEVAAILPPRAPEIFKQSAGRVLVVAGSAGMSGAAAMCATSALRAGAGVVRLAAPGSLNDILDVKLTEVMTVFLAETLDRSISLPAADEVIRIAGEHDILIVGPGLSTNAETVEAVRRIIGETTLPLVLDADGLNAVSGVPEAVAGRNGETIVTPHPGELARITGKDVKTIQADRLAAAGEAADLLDAVVILKGARTVVAAHDKMISVNPTGNPGMATAGTGDVLAGLTGGLWAQHMDAFDAAVAGAYLHGLSGDLAAMDLTEYALVATDLIEYLPDAFQSVMEAANRFLER